MDFDNIPAAVPKKKPLNLRVLDVDAFVHKSHALPVTSTMILEPSSSSFNKDGLFSEEIFGQMGTEERLTRFGYINLNTQIITPPVYVNLIKLGSFFKDLMSGNVYATWNAASKMFERVVGDPENVPGADTGYSFFLSHFHELEFEETGSLARKTKIDLIKKYRNIALCDKFLVEPAALRDVTTDSSGRLQQDDVNKLYTSLLAYASGIPPRTQSRLYDPIRSSIQAKVVEIYEYFNNYLSGKRGFLQAYFAARRLALGTRNVIAAATYEATSPDDPQFLKVDETKIGLFQTLKGFTPPVIYWMRTLFINPIFGDDGSNLKVPLVDPKTTNLEYVEISDETRNRFVTSDGIESWINRFRNADVRSKPITIPSADGKKNYYAYMVYDDGNSVCFFRSLSDLENFLDSSQNLDKSKIRPLTWVEAFYIAAYLATINRHVFVTRYPVIEDTSCYPSKIHLASTNPGRVVVLRDLVSGGMPVLQLPQYPILGNSYFDVVSVSVSRLAGLGADHDGDTVSINSVLSVEANRELAKYLASPKSMVDVQKKFITGGATDLVDLTFNVLSQPPRARREHEMASA